MKKTVVRIPSLLYKDLFDLGGDKLIAVFSILKGSREGQIKYYSYKAKNNKTVSGYSLLRHKTCLSLHSLKKYVPLLIEAGLCEFHPNGDFTIAGNRVLKKMYNTKLVPITLGKNFIDTQYNSFSVRLHSSSKGQKIMISKKRHRSELLSRFDDPRNYKEYKASRKVLKKYGGNIQITDKVVLSNQRYSEFKGKCGSKSSGSYYKGQLIKKGIIKSKRQFTLIKKMTYAEYVQHKKYNYAGNLTYMRGCLAMEDIATMEVMDTSLGFHKKSSMVSNKVSSPVQSKAKAIPMAFDFIAWWSGQPLSTR